MTTQNGDSDHNGQSGAPGPVAADPTRPTGRRAAIVIAVFLAALTLAGAIGVGFLLFRPAGAQDGTYCEGPVASLGEQRTEDSGDWERCTDERIRNLGLSVIAGLATVALAAATGYVARTIDLPDPNRVEPGGGGAEPPPGDGGGKSSRG